MTDPLACPDTTVSSSTTVTSGNYRVDFTATGGAGATGGTDRVAITVFWS